MKSTLNFSSALLLLSLGLPLAAHAGVTVKNNSNQQIWVACLYYGNEQGGFANTMDTISGLAGGFTLKAGETRTLVQSNGVTSAFLHITTNGQSYAPAGVASFALSKQNGLQYYSGTQKKWSTVYMVPEWSKLSFFQAVLGPGDNLRTSDGQALNAYPAGKLMSGSNVSNLPNLIGNRNLTFFQMNPRATFVYNGGGGVPQGGNPPAVNPNQGGNPPANVNPPRPPNANGGGTVIPLNIKFQNEYRQRVFITLKYDNGPGVATSLNAGERRSFSLLVQQGFNPYVMVSQLKGGTANFSIANGGDYVLRLDGGQLKNFTR